jgi:DNA polymerase V
MTAKDGSRFSQIRLVPANDRYPVIEVSEGSDFIMWGVVTYVIKKVR